MTDNPKVTMHTANKDHELFYSVMVRAAIDLKLRDEEVAALVGRMLGYQRAFAPETSSSTPHLVNVFRMNIREGMRSVQSGETKERSKDHD